MKKRIKKKAIIVVLVISFSYVANAQVAVNVDGSDPDASAMLDVKSTNKGVLLPRMNTFQLTNISNPAEGLLVYNTDSSDFYLFNGSLWISLVNPDNTLSEWHCGDQITDSRDGKNYATVQIDAQCWMAESMNIGTMINATNGGANSDGEQTDNSIFEKFCYDNSTANCDVYGGLYQWKEAMQYATTEGMQGICPAGWHFPTDAEWCTMEQFLDPTISCSTTGYRGTDGGGKLKEAGTTHWNSPNTGATNSSGFTALPGGYWRKSWGSFVYINTYTNFWTSTGDATHAWVRGLLSSSAKVTRPPDLHEWGFAVRCVKD